MYKFNYTQHILLTKIYVIKLFPRIDKPLELRRYAGKSRLVQCHFRDVAPPRHGNNAVADGCCTRLESTIVHSIPQKN